ncbi:YdcF family protein [Acetobacterium woodii]|uniref:DUF218 domain-containing protein n=1 Tax=Acetobacterium woodii (strain ATCC 29683 / DSM 1030 / JCM 2381 / KCTC 1655 / WB1) TaxID=931626 RepID=H6LEM8_ACEWD|nr:YdcF family protein [Acetobacterium woodii]AFA48131.1 hypothetical protein DUF218 [Acetobacterium woodii DSM 1030]
MTKVKNILKIIIKGLYFIQLFIFIIVVCLGIYLVVDTDRVVEAFAKYLVVEKSIHAADVIVVTSGDEDPLRIAEGIRLFKEGYSNYIIFSGYNKDNKMIHDAMAAAGLSESSYSIDDQATSTIENATFQEAYVKEHQVQSMLVVFSPPQSRRGLMAFRHTYKDLSIYVSYPDDSSYRPDALFESKVTRETLNDQALKFGYYFIKYYF